MDFTHLTQFITGLAEAPWISPVNLALRILLPLLSVWLLVRCGRSLLRGRIEQENWGRLTLPNGDSGTFHHWENTVGRSRRSDVVLQSPTVSRSHAAFLRDDKGSWIVRNISKNELTVNGEELLEQESAPIQDGDVISMGGVEVTFSAISHQEELEQAKRRKKPGRAISSFGSLLLLTFIQIELTLMLSFAYPDVVGTILFSFMGLSILMWGVYLLCRMLRRTAFEVETLAFYLTTLCMTITANKAPGDLFKQLMCIAVGLILFICMSLVLRNLTLAKKLRWPIAALAVALLAFNLLFGARLFGAKNWVKLGPLSFQPSELVKLAFILGGATTLDRMFSRRNLIFTLLFSAFCVGCLGLMSDFGTALIFFATFLAIAFLRSGDLPSVAFMGSAAAFGGYIIIHFKPYIARRFSIFLHAWSDTANLGYQQTRTMSAIAGGGLLGNGLGEGWLKNIAAANTDLVLGVVSDEMGFIVALCALSVIVILAVFAIKSAATARSTFYVIASCSTAMLFVVQTMLNVFGSVDLLPLTGVTFPFLSMGGSSIICCWGLLAYIKAADTRQNAALAVRLPSKRKAKLAAKAADTEIPAPDADATRVKPTRTRPERGSAKSARSAVSATPVDTMQDYFDPTVFDEPEQDADKDDDSDFLFDLDDDLPIESDADNWQDYFTWEDDDK